jgi:hypothetical protein
VLGLDAFLAPAPFRGRLAFAEVLDPVLVRHDTPRLPIAYIWYGTWGHGKRVVGSDRSNV